MTRAVQIVAGLAAACVVIAVLAAVFRDTFLALVTPDGGARVELSERYADGERGTLDIYAPADARAAPVVVFFYGGSWQMGQKSLYAFVGNALAARGIVAVIPDYRVYPDVKFPGFLEDGAAAVRWSKHNAARFGGDAERIFVMGHSAGAHIAAMLALDPQWLLREGLDQGRDIAGLVGLSGPYDFLPLTSENLIALFGGNNRPETQPVNFVTPEAPPSLLMTGDEDEIVMPRNSSQLAAKLRDADVPVEEIVYPGRGHFGTIMALIGPLNFLAPVLDDAARFIAAQPARAGS